MVLTNSEAFALVLSILTPFLVSFIKQPNWPQWIKLGLAVGISVIAGTGTAYFDNQLVFTPLKAVVDIAIVLAGSQAFYLRWFKDTALEQKLSEVRIG